MIFCLEFVFFNIDPPPNTEYMNPSLDSVPFYIQGREKEVSGGGGEAGLGNKKRQNLKSVVVVLHKHKSTVIPILHFTGMDRPRFTHSKSIGRGYF